MGEFLSDAPVVAIVLVVVGSILAFIVATPLEIRAARRADADNADPETPVMVREANPWRAPMLLNVAGYTCIAAGFALWIFGS